MCNLFEQGPPLIGVKMGNALYFLTFIVFGGGLLNGTGDVADLIGLFLMEPGAFRIRPIH